MYLGKYTELLVRYIWNNYKIRLKFNKTIAMCIQVQVFCVFNYVYEVQTEMGWEVLASRYFYTLILNAKYSYD